MALQFWLPLNGNVVNQGLNNSKFTIVSNDTNVSSQGKIGECYENTSFTSGGIISEQDVNLTQQHSMFCWFKIRELNSTSSLGGGLISWHNHLANSGTGLTIRYKTSTTGYLSVSTGNGDSRTYNTYYGTTELQANKWYHGGFTYDGSKIRIYLNGQLELEQAYPNMSCINNKIGLFCWSISNGTIYNNYLFKGSLNDVRIYNHVLSQQEINQLSQGLIIHYKMNYLFNENILNNNAGFKDYDGNIQGILNIQPNSSTIKYNDSAYFANYQIPYIQIKNSNKITNTLEEGTLTFWAKTDTNKSLLLSDDNNSHYLCAGNPTFYHYNSGTNLIQYLDSELITPFYESNKWHFYSIVGINLKNWSNIYINNYNNDWPLHGYLSDFRIYCTRLNAKQIQQLYQIPFIIDNADNTYGGEFIENDNNSLEINRNSLIKTYSLEEDANVQFIQNQTIISKQIIEI